MFHGQKYTAITIYLDFCIFLDLYCPRKPCLRCNTHVKNTHTHTHSNLQGEEIFV